MPSHQRKTTGSLLNHRVQVLLDTTDYLALLEMASGQDLSAFMRGLLRDERRRRAEIADQQPDSP